MPGKIWTGGFELGYAKGASGIPSLNTELKSFTEKYTQQRDLGDKRQKDFEEARKLFKQQQGEKYDPTVYEDQFDDTGITNFDVAGEKFRKEVKDLYELNQFAYNNGFINESQLAKRNSATKGQVQELSTLYDDINKFIESKGSLEAEGKKNDLNDLKLDLMDKFNKNFAVNAGLDGMYMSTIKNGERLNTSVSDFKRILNLEEGVDLDSVYDTLLQDQGFVQSIVSGKKVTKYNEQEGGMDVIDAKISSMTDGQIIGALLQSGDISAEDISDENIINPTATEENKQKLKESMYNQLQERQKRKQKTEIYRDPYRQRETPSETAKKDRLDASFDLALQATNGGEISENAVNKIKSINPDVTNMFGGVDEGVFVIQKKTKEGLEDITVDIIYNKDGSYNHVETAKAIFSAVDPKANPGEAETAAEVYAKRHPDYEYSQSPISFGGYAELPSADLIFIDEDRRTSALDKAYKEFDLYVTSLSNAEDNIREVLAKGYGLSESSGYQITSKGSLLGGGKAVEVKISDGTSFIFGSDMEKSEFLQKFNEMVNVISKQKSIQSKKSTDQSSKNFG
jgi:hypothetical protein